jgi:hypothetical protein
VCHAFGLALRKFHAGHSLNGGHPVVLTLDLALKPVRPAKVNRFTVFLEYDQIEVYTLVIVVIRAGHLPTVFL